MTRYLYKGVVSGVGEGTAVGTTVGGMLVGEGRDAPVAGTAVDIFEIVVGSRPTGLITAVEPVQAANKSHKSSKIDFFICIMRIFALKA